MNCIALKDMFQKNRRNYLKFPTKTKFWIIQNTLDMMVIKYFN